MSQDQKLLLHRDHNDISPTNIISQALLSLYLKTQNTGVKRHRQVHRVVTPAVVGSSPAAPAFCVFPQAILRPRICRARCTKRVFR